MIERKDQLRNNIQLTDFPQRIVSLVPSQTELLFYLGLDLQVVGITKFCIHPKDWKKTKTRVGGTKTIDIAKVRALKPDLIIGNKEENTKEDIEALRKIAPVWMSDIYTLNDALSMISAIGDITNSSNHTNSIVEKLKNGFAALKNESPRYSCAYFIWKNPYMIAGKQTFIDDLFPFCNLKNISKEERYPEWKLVSSEIPQVILLSSEPYPFKEQDLLELQLLYPNSFIALVDGELFSWYGSRLLLSLDYFKELKLKIETHFNS